MAKETLLTTRGNSFNIPFTKLKIIEGRNIREDLGDLKELSQSIAAQGIRTPIKVRELDKDKGVFEVIAGHRRYAAAKILYDADKTVIIFPALAIEKKATEADITAELLTDANSKDLTVLEVAEGISRLFKANMLSKDIAAKLGKAEPYVKELFRLANAPARVKKAIRNGEVSATLVRELLKKGKMDTLLEQLGEDPGAADTTGAEQEGGKGKAAKAPGKKITKKKLDKVNGMLEFKRFAKNQKAAFSSAVKEKEFWLMSDIFLQNNYDYDDLVKYFINGEAKKAKE